MSDPRASHGPPPNDGSATDVPPAAGVPIDASPVTHPEALSGDHPGALSGAHAAGRLAGLAAVGQLVEAIERQLGSLALPAPTPVEHLSLLHLAKAAGTTRSALLLARAGAWGDACMLARAVFEQLFGYMWVVQDPARLEARLVMVDIKQEWANAKYLEGLAVQAHGADRERLDGEVAAYRARADGLVAQLAATLGASAKQVRDEANRRASLKAIEVNLGPAYSLPYAYYSGFVHSDGAALALHARATAAGQGYGLASELPPGLPLASDLQRVLLRLVAEVRSRCPALDRPGGGGWLAEQAAELAAREGTAGEDRVGRGGAHHAPRPGQDHSPPERERL